jgi:uncharacterized sulfatase
VLAIADDLDPSHLGFLGNPEARTPRLDELARAGWLAPTLHAQPICRAALGVLLSGKWPHETGITANGADATLAPEGTLPMLLAAAGYATYCAGKFWEGAPPTYGFDAPAENDEEFARSGEDGQADLFRFLAERPREQPFFVWWAPSLPHTPHEPPAALARAFAEAPIQVPAEFEGRAEDLVAAERASLAMHAWMDLEFGRLVDELERLDELSSTVILFLADNGWSTWCPSKGTPREKGVRSPLVLSAPGLVRHGAEPERLVELVDVHATVLDYAELPAAASRGTSLRPHLEGRPSTPRERLFGTAHGRRGGLYALYGRDARWKYVLYLRDANPQELSPGPRLAPTFRRKAGAQELFDLERDPLERKNLARDPEHARALEEWRAATLAWWQTNGGGELELPPLR